MPTSESGYPIATATRGKKVIFGTNEKFVITDHDFSRSSFIPDTCLLHHIPYAESVKVYFIKIYGKI